MNPRTYNGSPFETFAGGDQQSLSSLAQIPCARVSTPIPSDTVESEVAGQQGPLQTSAAPVDDVAVDVPVLSRVNPRRGLTSGGDEIDLIVTNLPPSITLYARFGCNITPTVSGMTRSRLVEQVVVLKSRSRLKLHQGYFSACSLPQPIPE